MLIAEYTYQNDEWEIDGAHVCIGLTLEIEADYNDRAVQGLTVESVLLTASKKAAPVWISDAIGIWARANKTTLRDAFDIDDASIRHVEAA